MVNDRKEAFGVFWSIVALEHMLLGHPFTVQTDHRNLVYIEKSQVPKIICWHLRMQMFDLLLNTSLVTTILWWIVFGAAAQLVCKHHL